jgi:hypothetical protein
VLALDLDIIPKPRNAGNMYRLEKNKKTDSPLESPEKKAASLFLAEWVYKTLK